MATWNDLRDYIHSNYKINDEEPGLISLLFDLKNGRSQLVLVAHAEMNLSREQWVQIESAVGERRATRDAWPILDEVAKYVVGGLSTTGGYLTVRHAVPLADMSVEEFESPLQAVMQTADNLERMISRADAF
jgi:hypothetical protein